MKKTITTIVAVLTLCGAMTTFANVGNFLKEAADTTTQVSNAVNGPAKVTIADINSGQYTNKTVEVSSSITLELCDGT